MSFDVGEHATVVGSLDDPVGLVGCRVNVVLDARLPDELLDMMSARRPYAQIENLHVTSSTRSFLDDPCERMGTWAKKAGPRGSEAH